jgi:hypothetical protein
MSGERVVASSKKVEFKGGVISDTPLTATQAADIENLIPIPHQTTGLRQREGVTPVEDLDPTATGDIAVVKVITMADKPQTRLLAVVNASGETVEVLAENRDTYGRMAPVVSVSDASSPVAWGPSQIGTESGTYGQFILVSYWSPTGAFCAWHMYKISGAIADPSDGHASSNEVLVVRVSTTVLAIISHSSDGATCYTDFYNITADLAAGAYNATGGASGTDPTNEWVDPDAIDVVYHTPVRTASFSIVEA